MREEIMEKIFWILVSIVSSIATAVVMFKFIL